MPTLESNHYGPPIKSNYFPFSGLWHNNIVFFAYSKVHIQFTYHLKAMLFLIYSIACIPFLLSCLWQKHHIFCIFISSNSILHYTKFCISFIIGCDVPISTLFFHHFLKVGQAIVCNFFTFSSAN